MSTEQFLDQLRNDPSAIDFEDTMATIDASYDFSPTAFKNGDIENEANQNNGSCKIFAYAQLQALNADETLACFGQYYRDDVLKHPEGTDHGNIRNFMQYGWIGVEFSGTALTPKEA